MDNFAGQLLIAVPDLPDSNFYRSVVFMIEHSQDGAMGVVLNRPSELRLHDLWTKLAPEIMVQREDAVHLGGPVKGPLIGLHDQYSIEDSEVLDGVYMTMSSDRLNELVENSSDNFRAFNGYSGWGPGQLESELECGGWLLCNAKSEDVFADSDSLWKNICERFGHEIMLPPSIKNQNFGDPNLN